VKLYMSEASPFVRKVRLAAAERGLLDEIEPIILNPHDRRADLVAANPLSKVPTLIADDGMVHCDSLAICIYLDTLGQGPKMVPLSDFAVLQRHALANGAVDACVTRRMESLKASEPDRQTTLDRQKQTVDRVLDRFEQTIGEFGDTIAVDTLTLACALTYLDFRFPDDDWRANRPRLGEWLKTFEKRPAMERTRYPS
jgi:glutathione S-transferase